MGKSYKSKSLYRDSIYGGRCAHLGRDLGCGYTESRMRIHRISDVDTQNLGCEYTQSRMRNRAARMRIHRISDAESRSSDANTQNLMNGWIHVLLLLPPPSLSLSLSPRGRGRAAMPPRYQIQVVETLPDVVLLVQIIHLPVLIRRDGPRLP